MQFKSIFWKIVWTLFVLGIIYSVQPYHIIRVTGPSMKETYNDGQLVIGFKGTPAPADVHKGHVYVFNHNGERIVKRVTMEPGQWAYIVLRPDGNYQLTDDLDEITLATKKTEVYRVNLPSDQVYILGDNPPFSTDSRVYGLVPVTEIEAEVLTK